MITRTIPSERTPIMLRLCIASTTEGPSPAPHSADGA